MLALDVARGDLQIDLASVGALADDGDPVTISERDRLSRKRHHQQRNDGG
jgi:hypothetical protein